MHLDNSDVAGLQLLQRAGQVKRAPMTAKVANWHQIITLSLSVALSLWSPNCPDPPAIPLPHPRPSSARKSLQNMMPNARSGYVAVATICDLFHVDVRLDTQAGVTGPGRLHESFLEAATPISHSLACGKPWSPNSFQFQ